MFVLPVSLQLRIIVSFRSRGPVICHPLSPKGYVSPQLVCVSVCDGEMGRWVGANDSSRFNKECHYIDVNTDLTSDVTIILCCVLRHARHRLHPRYWMESWLRIGWMINRFRFKDTVMQCCAIFKFCMSGFQTETFTMHKHITHSLWFFLNPHMERKNALHSNKLWFKLASPIGWHQRGFPSLPAICSPLVHLQLVRSHNQLPLAVFWCNSCAPGGPLCGKWAKAEPLHWSVCLDNIIIFKALMQLGRCFNSPDSYTPMAHKHMTPPFSLSIAIYLSLSVTHTDSELWVSDSCGDNVCSSRSVKRGSGAVCPGGVRSQGGMFILSTAFDLLLLITSCTLYMNQAALCCWLNSVTRRERGRAAILDFLNRKGFKGQWVKACSLVVFNDHQILWLN